MKTSIEQQHAEMVRKLVKPNAEILDSLIPHDCGLIHATFGICGEAGEILDSVKKTVIYRKELDYENIVEELGDLEFYLEQLRFLLGISRESTLIHNLTKLAKRYEGYKYSDQAANERKDKQ